MRRHWQRRSGADGFRRRFRGRRVEDHLRQRALAELRLFGSAPAARPLAAESGIGQQAERGLQRIDPVGARVIVRKRDHSPESGAWTEFDTCRGMALGGARQAVERGVGANPCAPRSGATCRQQATTDAVHGPLVLIQRLPGQQNTHQTQRHKPRALPPHTAPPTALGKKAAR